jgi:membrane protease YdiL (CAAX protease family)
MPVTTVPLKTLRNRFINRVTYWREALFWLLLLPAFAALASGKPRREFVGLIETCAFVVLAASSTGRLKTLGLEFVAWERITRKATAVSALCGLAAGAAVVAIARLAKQPLGVERGWNKAMLAIVLGPVLEEVIFRGYLISLALRLTKRLAHISASAVSVLSAAALFALAHLGTPGITVLQVACIATTGCLYGWIRVRWESTAAAALTHATYNLTLYLSYWLGLFSAITSWS